MWGFSIKSAMARPPGVMPGAAPDEAGVPVADGAWRQRLVARAHIVFPLAAVALLLVSGGLLFAAHQTLAAGEARLQAAQLAREAAADELAQLAREAATAHDAAQLMVRAQRAGLGPGQWAIRRMDMHQVSMSRETLNEVLAQIAHTPSQMFGADDFELSVRSAGGSLFEAPVAGGGEASLSVTLSGTLYFHLESP